MQLELTRLFQIPDPIKMERFRRSPDLGPRVLFFSGGSALRKTCRELVRFTHNSIHIITTFDSGGSSAKLRDAFHMPAIGDVRNRLLALADRSLKGNPEIFALFAHRFPEDGDPALLSAEMDRMIRGEHPLVAAIHDPMRKIIRKNLDLFREYMPESFDLRKASMGNLILAAGYLENRRSFDIIIFVFSKLVQVCGLVRPILNRHLHLVAALENGEIRIGQHTLTGKETSPIPSPVRRIWLSDDRDNPTPVDVPIRGKMDQLIRKAELICYPMGSYYSSILANLLPRGVGRAVAANPCPKVFVPNTGNRDPESLGMSLTDQVARLIDYLKQDDPGGISTDQVLDFVLVDGKQGHYPGGVDEMALKKIGVRVIDLPLVSEDSRPDIDAQCLVPVLLSLC